MKFQIVLLGAFACLALTAQTQTTGQSARTNQGTENTRQPASAGQQSLTGCVDEQNGHYVLRDVRTLQLVSLQSPGPDDDSFFAKYLGHEAQVSGIKSSETFKVTRIEKVADLCGPGK